MILVKIIRCFLISWLFLGAIATAQNLIDVNAAHSPNLRIGFVNPSADAWRENAQAVAGYQLLHTGLGTTFSNVAVGFVYPSTSLGAFSLRGQSFHAHLLQQNLLEFGYSYRFWKHRAAIGLNMGLLSLAYDESRFRLEDVSDPLFDQKTSTLNLNLGIGALIEIFPQLLAGLSLNHLNQPNVALGNAVWKMPLQWHAGLFYIHPWISPLISLEQDQTETYFAIGAEHRFPRYHATLRGSYSPENLTFGVAYQFSNFILDYAYHYPLNELSEISSGSHEFFISYEFGAPTPDFELTLVETEPLQLEKFGAFPGAKVHYVIKSSSRHGFRGPIQLSLQHLPANLNFQITPTALMPDALSEVMLSIPATAAATACGFEIQGVAGNITHTLPLILKINPLPQLLSVVHCSIDSLNIIEYLEIREENPILNYIFFNENDARLLPERYHLTRTSEDLAATEELGQTALQQYRDLLNILGRRLQQHPQLKISLVGYTSNANSEQGNLELARQRANAVRDYLYQTWQIPAAQLRVEARRLPDHPSADTDLGRQENQRVEIVPDPGSEEILAAMITRSSQTRLSDSACVFHTTGTIAEAGLEHWELAILDDAGSMVRQWSGQTDLPSQITWNWTKSNGQRVPMRPYFNYQLKLVDRLGQVSQSPLGKIMTNYQVIETLSQRQRVEKFRLILFEFAREEVDISSPQIQQKLAQIVEKFKAVAGARIRLKGYTDIIGTPEFNRELAFKRAKSIFNQLVRMGIPAAQISYEGLGQDSPLITNDLPEGRMMNRRVEIYIEYP
ncbi:MAG: OmpA family protein [candidate division KSB1 bacterium]|nr:OmpA family protein [candidate division KSB1 bacterium]